MSLYRLMIDTSSSALQMLLFDSSCEFVQEEVEWAPYRHVQILIPRLQEFLKRTDIQLCDLEGILCVRGPGSFTGIRIALATTKALSFSLSIPCGGVSAFEVLLHAMPLIETLSYEEKSLVVCLVSAGRDRFYLKQYQVKQESFVPLLEAKTVSRKEVESLLEQNEDSIYLNCVGNDEERVFFESLSCQKRYIYSALPIGQFIHQFKGNFDMNQDAQKLLPLYLLPSVRS